MSKSVLYRTLLRSKSIFASRTIGRLGCLIRTALLIVITVSATPLWAITPDAREVFRQALTERSKEWASGAVDEVADCIVNLQGELRITFTNKQVGDIAAGLRDPTWEQVIAGWTHPLVRNLYALRIQHGVRQYLVKGPADEAERQKAVEQLHELVKIWQQDLGGQYPDQAEVIARGVELAVRDLEQKAHNPLRCTYLLVARDPAREQADRDWRELKQTFRLNPKDDLTQRVRDVQTLFLRSTNALVNDKEKEAPKPPALATAERAVTAKASEISEWQRLAFHRSIEQAQQAKERNEWLADISETPHPSAVGAVGSEQEVHSLPWQRIILAATTVILLVFVVVSWYRRRTKRA